MMKILAVNTANVLLSLAVVQDGKLLQSFESLETRDQGNLLLRHIREALGKLHLKFQDLDLLAVVTGPGSFTGIRIGLATMRALSMAAKVPLIGVSSFELFAQPKEGAINLIAVESFRDELYFQGIDGKGSITVTPVNLTPEDFAKTLPAGNYTISGDAAAKLHEVLPKATLSDHRATAADAARIGQRLFEERGGERPVPYYLREADISTPKNQRA